MSMIGECHVVSVEQLSALVTAASTPAPPSGESRHPFDVLLDQHSVAHFEYRWAGHVFGTLLIYLSERGANLMDAHEEAASALVNSLGASFFVLTPEHRELLPILDSSTHSREELRRFYETFNEVEAEGVDQALIDGMDLIAAALKRLDDTTVALLAIR